MRNYMIDYILFFIHKYSFIWFRKYDF